MPNVLSERVKFLSESVGLHTPCIYIFVVSISSLYLYLLRPTFCSPRHQLHNVRNGSVDPSNAKRRGQSFSLPLFNIQVSLSLFLSLSRTEGRTNAQINSSDFRTFGWTGPLIEMGRRPLKCNSLCFDQPSIDKNGYMSQNSKAFHVS